MWTVAFQNTHQQLPPIHSTYLHIHSPSLTHTCTSPTYSHNCSQDVDKLPNKVFLAVQCTCLAIHLSLRKSLWRASHQQQQQLERTKSWVHLLFTVASMVVVLFSNNNIPSSFSIIVTTWLAVVDLLRLQTLLELHMVKCVCFIILQLDRVVLPFFLMTTGNDTRNSSSGGGITLWGDFQAALVFGTLLPFTVAAILEGGQRSEFLEDLGQPQSFMPPVFHIFRIFKGGGVESSSTIAGGERQHID